MSSYVFELLPNLKRLDLHVAGAECGEKLNCSVTQDSILFLTPEGDCDVLQLPFPHSRGEHELSRADSETLTIRFPLQTTPDASPFIGHTLSELSAPRLEELDVKQMRALACRVCGAVLTENPPQQIFSLPSLHWRDWASELWFCHPPQEHTAKVNARTKFVLKPGTWMIGNTEIHTLREECRAVTGNLSAESKSEAGQPHPPEEEEEEEEEEPYLKCPECSAIVGVLVPEIDSLDSHPRSGCGSDPGKDDSESKQAGTAGRKQKTETEEEKYRAGLWKHCVGILPDDLYQNLSVETYIAQRIIAMTEGVTSNTFTVDGGASRGRIELLVLNWKSQFGFGRLFDSSAPQNGGSTGMFDAVKVAFRLLEPAVSQDSEHKGHEDTLLAVHPAMIPELLDILKTNHELLPSFQRPKNLLWESVPRDAEKRNDASEPEDENVSQFISFLRIK